MTDQNKLQNQEISNDDRKQVQLIEQVAEVFSNPQFTELLASDPDEAFTTSGLNPQEVYQLLRNPAILSKALKSRKAS